MTQVYENIVKPPKDNRNYRGLILKNEMKVLIISDPTNQKAAASLGVNVGYFNDPDELPGLAHFCEHMLFMGNEKYPDANEYINYIKNHGGYTNASTCQQLTTFIFSIAPEFLKEALDRFSQFFIAPLFRSECIEKEVNAVHAEHLKNIPIDARRAERIDSFISNPEHPYHHYGGGSIDTLFHNPKSKGIDIRDELLKFHEQWYSSNIMTMVVIGQENLNDLQQIVEELFEKIPNKNVEVSIRTDYPFTEDQLGTITKVLPIQDQRVLKMVFPLKDLRAYYKSAPDIYLKALFQHGGKGSLLSMLRNLGWCTEVMVCPKNNFGFGFFYILIYLTKDGLNHTGDIGKIVFQYINMLKQNGPQQYFFNECSMITNNEFIFLSKEKEVMYALRLVVNLFFYPIEEAIFGPYAICVFEPALIQNILETFTPENVRIILFAKEFERECDQNDEPYFGILYHTEKLSEDKMIDLQDAGTHDNLYLPCPNQFIPMDFEILPLRNITPYPEIMINNPYMRVWFKQDSVFRIPKLIIKLKLLLPTSLLDAESYNSTCLYIELFKDFLNEELYDAKIVGLKWQFSYCDQSIRAIIVSLEGYSSKMGEFICVILDRMRKFHIDPKRFDILLEQRKLDLRNFEVDQPVIHGEYYLNTLINEVCWTNDELYEACEVLTPQKLQDFGAFLFSKIYVEMLIYGNCNKVRAMQFSKLVENYFGLLSLFPVNRKQNRNNREHKLDEGKEYIYKRVHKYHISSCSTNLYQCGTQDTKNSVLMNLLIQIISQPCFDQLRTKEQLGYILGGVNKASYMTNGLMIFVQSEKSPAYVDSRIENFLKDFGDLLKQITPEQFQIRKDALTVSLLEKPKNLAEQCQKFWIEIISQHYHFNRYATEAAYLKNVTREDLFSFYKGHIDKSGDLRSKLTIHVKSTLGCSEDREEGTNKYIEISDPVMFKNSTSLYSIIKPHILLPNHNIEVTLD